MRPARLLAPIIVVLLMIATGCGSSVVLDAESAPSLVPTATPVPPTPTPPPTPQVVASEPQDAAVLVVTATIPAGTTVAELLEAPTAYLTIRAIPARFVAADALQSITDLGDLAGFELAAEVYAGEQLLASRFVVSDG